MGNPTWLTRALGPSDPDYPSQLACLASNPGSSGPVGSAPVLHVRGRIPDRPMLAIVGTRQPDVRSIRWTHELVETLARAGFAIGSGGARGIDEAAHRAALASTAPTVAITVGGLDRACEGEMGPLFRAILDAGGALISLAADGAPVERADFFRRNHILVALSCGVVAVELRSRPGQGGTGHTVRAARGWERPVMTVAHPPWSSGGLGALALSRIGVPFVGGAEDVLACLSPGCADGDVAPLHANPDARRKPSRTPRGRLDLRRSAPSTPSGSQGEHEPPLPTLALRLDDDAAAVVGALGHEPTHIEHICVRTGFDAPRAIRALLSACLEGAASEVTPGRYLRTRGFSG